MFNSSSPLTISASTTFSSLGADSYDGSSSFSMTSPRNVSISSGSNWESALITSDMNELNLDFLFEVLSDTLTSSICESDS